jgi:hypothetical protein
MMGTAPALVPQFGQQRPCGVMDPPETLHRALEIPIGHFSEEASKGQPPAPSREITGETAYFFFTSKQSRTSWSRR